MRLPALRLIDPCAPRAYATTADLAGLGGTEATVLRIVAGLAPLASVTVEQSARKLPVRQGSVAFEPMDLSVRSEALTIVINSWKVALTVARRNPGARVYVWQHVVPGRHNRAMAADLSAAGITLLCVSGSLRNTVSGMLDAPVRSRVLYNPISDDLHPDRTPRDRDLLIFASAPHKGLDQVLQAFCALRQKIPSLKLELADPGYLAWPVGDLPHGVVRLGSLSHAQAIARMRAALCLFYPQQRFAETFGLVIAEANAVGTPALLHCGLGANDEVASDKTQCIDGSDPDEIAERIQAWRTDPPQVRANPEFRLRHVLSEWGHLLSGAPITVAA